MVEPTTNTIQRSYRLRVYPNAKQQATLGQWFGAGRWIWNHSLERRRKAYQRRGERVTGVDVSRALTDLKRTSRYHWLAGVPSAILQQKLRDQDRAFTNFFAGRAERPKFKKRGQNDSVRLTLDQRHASKKRRWESGEVVIPGLGALKYRDRRHPHKYPKMATLRRDAIGRYFVTVTIDEPAVQRPSTTRVVGIDLGLKDLMVLSTGEKIGNPRPLRCSMRRLKRAQRALSRKRRASKRYRKQKEKVARLHARVKDTRSDVQHKLTRRLVDENQILCVESLNVLGLSRSILAASVHDAAWGELLRQLTYKAEWAGRTVAPIGRWAPSTRMCSLCAMPAGKFDLKVRSWRCIHCSAVHDRDINAAVNIRELGIARLLPEGTLPEGTLGKSCAWRVNTLRLSAANAVLTPKHPLKREPGNTAKPVWNRWSRVSHRFQYDSVEASFKNEPA